MAASAWQKLWPPGRGLVNIDHLNRIFTGAAKVSAMEMANLTVDTALTAAAISLTGTYKEAVTTIAAAGATVGTATAIPATASLVNVTVTASTEGVKLPSITTVGVGAVITVMPSTTVGVKVYAGVAGQSIGTGTTNTTALAVVLNTVKSFIAISSSKWRAQ